MMSLNRYLLIIIFIVLPGAPAVSQSALAVDIPFYDITISESAIRKVNVEATFPRVKDTVYMSQSEYAPLKDGYATYVHDLNATDLKGKPVTLTALGKGVWKVNRPVPAGLKLTYQISMDHDAVEWTVSGPFARSYALNDVLFFAGRTVFIVPKGLAASKFNVHFSLPKGWNVATPFSEVPGKPVDFIAQDLSDLWRNGNFIGRFVQEEINVGKLKVIIAGTPVMKQSVVLFRNTLKEIITRYESEMGGAPEGKLVIMSSVSSMEPGGEAFKRSISMMFSRPPDESNKQQWGYLIAHEVFHLWNGQAITATDQSKVEWFVEGFTEYVSRLTSYKTGFISQSDFVSQMRYGYSVYSGLAGEISLVDAGARKGQNYDLIYSGGMYVANALNAEIRRATGNKKNIIDLMKTMYSKFGKTGKRYSYNDIVDTSSEIAGVSMSAFFKRFVSGTETIPKMSDKDLINSLSPE